MQWIDLSLPIKTGMPVFPGDPEVSLETVRSHARDDMQLSRLVIGSHTGTHLDAPRHFLAEGESVDQLPLDRCCGTAFVATCPWQPGKTINLNRLDISGFVDGDMLLLATGWDSRAGTKDYYREVPEFSVGSAVWLLRKGIRLFGLDLPNVVEAGDPNCPEAMHLKLLGAGMVLVESLAGLMPLAGKRVEFQALPLRLVGGDGSPVRACGKVMG